jgi:hypothetical protein
VENFSKKKKQEMKYIARRNFPTRSPLFFLKGRLHTHTHKRARKKGHKTNKARHFHTRAHTIPLLTFKTHTHTKKKTQKSKTKKQSVSAA